MRAYVAASILASLLVGCGGPAVTATSPKTAAAAADAPRAEAPPATRPADFAWSLSLEDGAGAKATNLSCDGAGCVMTQLQNGELARQKADVTPAELDAVYAVVTGQRFDQVAYAKVAPAPDATAVTLWVKAGPYYGAMHRANEDPAAADKRFDALAGAIRQVATEVHLDLDKPLPGVLVKAPAPAPSTPAATSPR